MIHRLRAKVRTAVVTIAAVLALSTERAAADAFQAIANGNWSNPGIWLQNGGAAVRIPGDLGFTSDTVLIGAGFLVVQDAASVAVASVTITTTSSSNAQLLLSDPLVVDSVTISATSSGTALLEMNGQNLTVNNGNAVVQGTVAGTARLLNGSTTDGALTISGSGTLGGSGGSSEVTLLDLVVGVGSTQTTTLGTNLPALTVRGNLVVAASATLDLNGRNLALGDPSGIDNVTVNGTVTTTVSAGTTTVSRSVGGVSGSGTMTVFDLVWGAGSGGGQTTTIATTLTVLDTFLLNDAHHANLTGTLILKGPSDPITNLPPGAGVLTCAATSLISYEQTAAATIDVSTSSISGNFGNLRFNGGASTTFNYGTSTKTVAGNLEVVSGTLVYSANSVRTVNGDLFLGVAASNPALTGSGVLNASSITSQSLIVMGGDVVFGTGGTLVPPAIVTLNGTGRIEVPDTTGAVLATLNVGQGGATTTVVGPGTVFTTILNVGTGLLQGGGGAPDTATIDISGTGSAFVAAAADFQANNLTVRYSSPVGVTVRNVTYGHLTIAVGGGATASCPQSLSVAGDLQVTSGTLSVGSPATSISVGANTIIASGATLAVTTGVSGSFGTGLTVNGGINAAGGPFAISVVAGNLSKTGPAPFNTANGSVTVNAGIFVNAGSGAVTLGTGDLTVVGDVTVSLGSVSLDILTAAASVSVSNPASLTMSGAFIAGNLAATGFFPVSPTTVINFNGSGASTISTTANLPTITKSNAGSLTFSTGATLTGSLNVSAGTVSLGGQSVSVGDDVTVSAGGTLDGSAGTLTLTGASAVLGGAGSTTLQNVVVDGVTALGSGPLAVNGTLTVNSGDTLNASAASPLTVGTLASNGTFGAPAGILRITTSFTHSGAGAFNNNGGTVEFTGGATFARGTGSPAQLAHFTVLATGAGPVSMTQGLDFTGNGAVTGNPLNVTGTVFNVNGGLLTCAQPVTYTGGATGSLLVGGTIAGTASFVLRDTSYTAVTGTISVVTFIYDGIGVARTASRRAYAGGLQFTGSAPTTFTLGGTGTWSIGGILTVADADVSVNATGVPSLTLTGGLSHTAGTFSPPLLATFVAPGQLANLQTAATLHALTLGSGAIVRLLGPLAVDGTLTVQAGATYLANGNNLTFAGTASWTDATGLQNFGNVTVQSGTITAQSPLTMEGFTVSVGGTFNAQGHAIGIRANLAAAGTITPAGSTFTFLGPANAVAIAISPLANVTVAKSAGVSINFTGGWSFTGNLILSSGEARLSSSTTVGGAVLVNAGTTLRITSPGAASHAFAGPVHVSGGGHFLLTKTDAPALGLTFSAGVVVDTGGELDVDATGASAGTVSLLFAANSGSRVGPVTPGSDTTTIFAVRGRTGAKNVILNRAGGAGGQQWFLAYNRATEAAGAEGIVEVQVSNSDATAGSMVRARASLNGGNNENWNFGAAPILDPIGGRTVAEGATLQFTLNAADTDGDTLTYSATGLPPGAAFDPPTRAFSWTPDSDQAGVYPGVTFQVSDGQGGLDSEAITITVTDAAACGEEIVIVPDGRLSETTLTAGGTAWFGLTLRIGSSYSIEFANTGGTTPPGTLTVFSGDDACSGTSTLAAQNTVATDPAGTSGAVRVSFTATGTLSYFRARLESVSGQAVPYSFTVSETTLFSPAWSTNGAFDTFYSFQNTTGATISGTLTLYDTAGAAVATAPLTIPAGQAGSANTASLGIPDAQAGTARFVHDGPPGAVTAEAAIANFGLNPAYVQPVKFQAMREAR